MLAATLMIAHHIAGKAARDALFLTHFDVSRLPQMMMVSAGVFGGGRAPDVSSCWRALGPRA